MNIWQITIELFKSQISKDLYKLPELESWSGKKQKKGEINIESLLIWNC